MREKVIVIKYCLRSRLSYIYLQKADEIRFDYRDRETIFDFVEKYPNKTFILFPGNEPFNWEEIRKYNSACQSNFVLNVRSVNEAILAKENNIKFMLNYEATSYWDLEGLVNLGAEYAYVGIPLFFNLKNTLNYNIKLRAVPTVAYNHALSHNDGVCGQWIRPEDVELYEDYIDVLEFEPCEIKREQTLFIVYAEDKKFNTRLDILVQDLGSNAINRLIPPNLAEARISCRQKCKTGSSCKLCYNILSLANPDLILPLIEKK